MADRLSKQYADLLTGSYGALREIEHEALLYLASQTITPGLGTSGTFMGTGRGLRRFNPAIKLFSFQPDSPFHGLEGLKHMASALVPPIYDSTLADEDVRVSTERAFALTRRLATEEGLLVGVSSGAALAATLDLAERIREGVIVTIFPDSGTRYLSESFWDAHAQR